MVRQQRILEAAAVIALMTLGVPVAAQAPSDPNLFMEAVIDSLATTAEAHSLVLKVGPTDFEQMVNTRLAITKIKDAQQLVTPFVKNDDAMTSDVASVFSGVYESLGQLIGQNLEIFEKLIRLEARVLDGAKGNYVQELAELKIALSKLGAEIDGAWKRVAEISALSTNILVDRNRRDAGGKFSYLQITSKERTNLRARLERFFDRQMLQKAGAGQHAVQFAPALLWQFLGQSEWKSADAP